MTYVEQYADHVRNSMHSTVTRCKPLMEIGQSAVGNVCKDILNPMVNQLPHRRILRNILRTSTASVWL